MARALPSSSPGAVPAAPSSRRARMHRRGEPVPGVLHDLRLRKRGENENSPWAAVARAHSSVTLKRLQVIQSPYQKSPSFLKISPGHCPGVFHQTLFNQSSFTEAAPSHVVTRWVALGGRPASAEPGAGMRQPSGPPPPPLQDTHIGTALAPVEESINVQNKYAFPSYCLQF